MADLILGTEELPILGEADVMLVRGRVRELALRHGFDKFSIAAITTATSELTRNAWVHGGGGSAQIVELDRGGRRGLRLVFRDQGPGIDDVDRTLAGGYSTARSLGLGLSGSRRLVDEFQIDSRPGGTTVTVAKWARFTGQG